MTKIYNNCWNAKPLTINFNQKQWRQDIAAFCKERLSWVGGVKVTRSKTITKGVNIYSKGVRQFDVFNDYGDTISIQYQNNNEIVSTTNEELVKMYIEERNML